MAGCDTTSITKACSGKCKSNACAVPDVWVVAACEGMISLFSRSKEGTLSPVPPSGSGVFPSLDAFQEALATAERAHRFDQLIIIGSSNDIAWIHASLPESVTLHIAAEINYPLVAAWFKQPLPLARLTQALESVFVH